MPLHRYSLTHTQTTTTHTHTYAHIYTHTQVPPHTHTHTQTQDHTQTHNNNNTCMHISPPPTYFYTHHLVDSNLCVSPSKVSPPPIPTALREPPPLRPRVSHKQQGAAQRHFVSQVTWFCAPSPVHKECLCHHSKFRLLALRPC